MINLSQNNKLYALIIIVIIVAVSIFIGLFIYQSKNNQLNQLDNNESETQQINNNYNDQTLNLTPEMKYETAEIIAISNGEHHETVTDFENTVKVAFGDGKITGYTQGYMGMNSGSGIAQITISRLLNDSDVNTLTQAMTNQGYSLEKTDKQENSIYITAQKNNYQYRISFNYQEQEITVIIEASK